MPGDVGNYSPSEQQKEQHASVEDSERKQEYVDSDKEKALKPLNNTIEILESAEGAAETASSAAAFAQCWGESAIPDGAMALLEQVGIGAELIGEFVPGAGFRLAGW